MKRGDPVYVLKVPGERPITSADGTITQFSCLFLAEFIREDNGITTVKFGDNDLVDVFSLHVFKTKKELIEHWLEVLTYHLEVTMKKQKLPKKLPVKKVPAKNKDPDWKNN